jgi:hypothetical protein
MDFIMIARFQTGEPEVSIPFCDLHFQETHNSHQLQGFFPR